MIVRMPLLFDACEEVLWSELRPLHYAVLTRMALTKLGVSASQRGFEQLKEDVREKMLKSSQRGCFYIGKPHCLACVRDWFKSPIRNVFNDQAFQIRIPASVHSMCEAFRDSLQRAPYMKTKYTNSPARWEALRRGKATEQHISDWFHFHWPELWVAPDNAGQPGRGSWHDFKLRIGPTPVDIVEVDVMGQHANGQFCIGDKQAVDIHLIASEMYNADEYYFPFHGFVLGPDLPRREFGAESPHVSPPSRLVVFLNCLKHGVNHDFIRKCSNGVSIYC